MTKLEMARVIVKALYNMDDLPAINNVHVQRQAKQRKTVLEHRHKLALAALASVGKAA